MQPSIKMFFFSEGEVKTEKCPALEPVSKISPSSPDAPVAAETAAPSQQTALLDAPPVTIPAVNVGMGKHQQQEEKRKKSKILNFCMQSSFFVSVLNIFPKNLFAVCVKMETVMSTVSFHKLYMIHLQDKVKSSFGYV